MDVEASSLSSLLDLAPSGGCLAARIAAGAGGLLRHLFTITVTGSLFSVALFRQVSSEREVPRPGYYPTPCSMECRLSSIPLARDRDRPTGPRSIGSYLFLS
jgi:hypothetical protein